MFFNKEMDDTNKRYLIEKLGKYDKQIFGP